MAGLDWAGLRDDVAAALVDAVRRVVAENPGEIFYAAGLYAVYRETGRTLGLPAAA